MSRVRFVRSVLGLALLLPQVVALGVARIHPMRFYCWSPYDAQFEYTIETAVGGRRLTSEEVSRRYDLPTPGRNPRAIHQVTTVISHVERVYRTADEAQVTVTYRKNGGVEQQWHWPAR
ncbi:MAG: hypothetical protein ACT4PE_00775 [Candidatus Eiseniibacteriota bacterium]